MVKRLSGGAKCTTMERAMVKTKDCKACGKTFKRTGQADKFCLDCRDVKDGKPKSCTICGESLPIQRGPKKYCKKCAEESAMIRQFNRSIKKSEGGSCVVSFPSCIVCTKRFSRPKSKNGRVEVCGKSCMDRLYEKTRIESERWLNYPFYFRLSDDVVKLRRRLIRQSSKNTACTCEFCGSVKIAGDAQSRNVAKGRRFFCDLECSYAWKSIHYASANHKPFEESRQRTRARRAIEAEQARKRKEEAEIARLIKPVNAKTSGYATCTVCSRTSWVEHHANKRFCTSKCAMKAYRKTERYKARRREYNRNREHIKRSKGIGEKITIPDLMRKYKGRCVNCQTTCVRPEGYNWDNEANIDHILPIAAGGLHIWSNVQLLCRRCNIAKSDRVLPGTQLMLDLRFK